MKGFRERLHITCVDMFPVSSSSRFRLRAERDWDEADGDERQDPDFLSINVADMAAAVQCVPLHTRLGLGQELFGVSTLPSKLVEGGGG